MAHAQMRQSTARETLERVLNDGTDSGMVRHECAEALGAIGHPASLPVLERLADADPEVEIRQTCEVARNFARWKVNGASASGEARPGVVCACMLSPYSSHDPAPADPRTDALSAEAVGALVSMEATPRTSLAEETATHLRLRWRAARESVAGARGREEREEARTTCAGPRPARRVAA